MARYDDFIMLSKDPARRAAQVRLGEDIDLDAAIRDAPSTPLPADDPVARILERLERRATAEREAAMLRSAEQLRAERVAQGRGRRGTGPLSIIRQGLRDYAAENQELADATGDLSLKEGLLGFSGLVGGVAAPLAVGRGALAALSGTGLSVGGDALMDQAARKILGASIQDPLSSGLFGAVAGKTGKILPGLLVALGSSSGDAEGSVVSPLRQLLYRGLAQGAPEGERLYASAQRPVAEYYAAKRSAQTGRPPQVQALLVDPAAGRRYGHALPLDRLNREVHMTQARELSPEDILQSWALE